MGKPDDVGVSVDRFGYFAVTLRDRADRRLGFSLSLDAARELVEQLVAASNKPKP